MFKFFRKRTPRPDAAVTARRNAYNEAMRSLAMLRYRDATAAATASHAALEAARGTHGYYEAYDVMCAAQEAVKVAYRDFQDSLYTQGRDEQGLPLMVRFRPLAA